jgi:invasion protein IalB
MFSEEKQHLLILSESIDMQHLYFLLFFHLILINVNLVQQDATIQEEKQDWKLNCQSPEI